MNLYELMGQIKAKTLQFKVIKRNIFQDKKICNLHFFRLRILNYARIFSTKDQNAIFRTMPYLLSYNIFISPDVLELYIEAKKVGCMKHINIKTWSERVTELFGRQKEKRVLRS